MSPLLVSSLLFAAAPAGVAPADREPLVAPKPAVAAGSEIAAPTRTVYPFNGHDLDGWEPQVVPPWKPDTPRGANLWVVGVCAPKPDDPGRLVIGTVDAGDAPELIAPGRGADLATVSHHGDMTVSLDYLLPAGSNAGVIPHGRYELQLLDADHRQAKFQAKDLVKAGGGGLHKSGHLSAYGYAAPTRMPDLAPGKWHSLSFTFVAPRFGPDGAKTADARFARVAVDGVTVLTDAAMSGSTGKRERGAETPTGPLVLQGDHGPVAFRNLRIEVPAE